MFIARLLVFLVYWNSPTYIIVWAHMADIGVLSFPGMVGISLESVLSIAYPCLAMWLVFLVCWNSPPYIIVWEYSSPRNGGYISQLCSSQRFPLYTSCGLAFSACSFLRNIEQAIVWRRINLSYGYELFWVRGHFQTMHFWCR